MTESEAPTSSLSTGDRIGIAAAAASIIGLALFPFPASSFRRMFADLGNVELPLLTQLVISTWFPLVLAFAWSVLLALGARKITPLKKRRTFVIIAFAGAALSLVMCVIGLYLPIFALAGAIKAE